MALPKPLNDVEDLLKFTNFKHGTNSGPDSIAEGNFSMKQFEAALKHARYEIYRKTVRKQNEDFADDRLEEIREAELWLATARLMPKFGERIAIQTTDANLASVSSVLVGGFSADVKSGKDGEPCDGNTVLTRLIAKGKRAA